MAAPETLPLLRWTCGGCGARLLGLATELGAVHVQQSHDYRRDCPAARHVLVDLEAGTIVVHCSNCHAWRRLRFERHTGEISEDGWRGPSPRGAACSAA